MTCRVANIAFGHRQNRIQHARPAPGWEDAAMREEADTAQARELLHCLYIQIDEISQRLEAAEEKSRHTNARRYGFVRREAASLRQELYEAHRRGRHVVGRRTLHDRSVLRPANCA